MATLIRVDGSRKELPDSKLKTLQKAVGGYIESTPAKDNMMLFVNEEGKLDDLPYNEMATKMLLYPNNDYIVGDAVLVTEEEYYA